MAVGVEAAHGRPLPKNRASDSGPLGGNGPQYEGTVALDEYPFGKRLILNLDFQPTQPNKVKQSKYLIFKYIVNTMHIFCVGTIL